MYHAGILHGSINTESVAIVADQSGVRRGRLIKSDRLTSHGDYTEATSNIVKTICNGRHLGLKTPQTGLTTTWSEKDEVWQEDFEFWYRRYTGNPRYPGNPHLSRDAALRVYGAFDDDDVEAAVFLETLKTEFPDLLALKRPASLIFLRLFFN